MAADKYEGLRTIDHCVYCGKKRGVFTTFTQHGFCEKCNSQVRQQIKTALDNIKTCEVYVENIPPTAAREALIDAVKKIDYTLVLIDDLEIIRPKVPFFKTNTEQSKKRLETQRAKYLATINSPMYNTQCSICKKPANKKNPLTEKGVCLPCKVSIVQTSRLLLDRINTTTDQLRTTDTASRLTHEEKLAKCEELQLCIKQLHINNKYIDVEHNGVGPLDLLEHQVHDIVINNIAPDIPVPAPSVTDFSPSSVQDKPIALNEPSFLDLNPLNYDTLEIDNPPLSSKLAINECCQKALAFLQITIDQVLDKDPTITLNLSEKAIKCEELQLCIKQLYTYKEYFEENNMLSSLSCFDRFVQQVCNIYGSINISNTNYTISTPSSPAVSVCDDEEQNEDDEETFFVLKTYNKTKSTPLSFIVVDLETTGFSPETEQIIEIGAIKYVDGVETERYSSLVKPTKHIPAGASRVNHIYDKTVADAPSINEVLPAFMEFIDNTPLVFHNASFDMSFLQTQIFRLYYQTLTNPVIDTLDLARKHLPDLPNHKLDTIKRHFKCDGVSHRAVDDCVVTAVLYLFCVNASPGASSQGSFFKRIADDPDYEEAMVTYDQIDKIIFAGHSFVITGDMDGYPRSELKEKIEHLGGKCASSPSKKTDYLIVGMQNKNLIKDTASVKSKKIIDAENLRTQGEKIKIISDEFFLSQLEAAAHEVIINV